MRVKYLGIIMVLSSLSFIAIAEEEKPTPPEKFTNSNKIVFIKKENPSFRIMLRANPTTGYIWVLQSDYLDRLIMPLAHTFEASSPSRIGAPGIDIFDFNLADAAFTVPQIMHITFEYVRLGQVEKNPQKTTFTIMTS